MIDATAVLPDGADRDIGYFWACVSGETLRRTTELARRVLNVPRAMLVSCCEGHRVCSSSAAPEAGGSIAPPPALCHHVVASGDPIAAPPIAENPVVVDVPLGQGIAAYLGVPVRLTRGPVIGTLCVCDGASHAWRDDDLDSLAMLAAAITTEIELRLEIARRDGVAGEPLESPARGRPADAAPVDRPRGPDAPGAPAKVADVETPAPGGARILLADDLDLNRKLIADMLSCEGHSVDCVADGAAAVRAAGERSYDLILMDMIMPVMDGTAATRAIRALPEPACRVPIVALTAHSFREQLDACLAAGMDDTLTKPLSMTTLTAAVDEWTRGRTQAA